MHAQVRPINVRGKPLPKSVRLKEAAVLGNLRVFENRLHMFGRAVTCATLTDTRDGLNTPKLPELLDVEIIWMDEKSMRLRGVEMVDDTLYGQTWEITLTTGAANASR